MSLSPPSRCLYFVTGNQPERLRAVPQYRPDRVVIDLESSVPPAEVPAAPATLSEHVEALRAAGQHVIMVRLARAVPALEATGARA